MTQTEIFALKQIRQTLSDRAHEADVDLEAQKKKDALKLRNGSDNSFVLSEFSDAELREHIKGQEAMSQHIWTKHSYLFCVEQLEKLIAAVERDEKRGL